MPARSLALTGIVVLTLGLAGCGQEGDDLDGAAPDPASTATSPATTPPTPTPTAPAAPAVDAATIVVPDLPTGSPPQVDVVVDATLFHDGREIPLPDALMGAYPLGTYDGRTYVSAGAQVVTVADDGTLAEVGEPHDTYNRFPELVPATGHVLFTVQNRNGPSVVTVMDAVTGEDLAVVTGAYRKRASQYDALDPADRALAEGWDHGAGMDDVYVTARSADGTLEVVRNEPMDVDTPVTLTLQSAVDGDGATAFAFPSPEAATFDVVHDEQVVVESDDSFLMVAGVGEIPDGFESVVVRCTTDGTCELATPIGTQVQVAGTSRPLPARAS